MATETQKKFREEMKAIRKENPDYFEKNDLYLKRTSSLKRKVIRGITLSGAVILIIRIILFIIVYVLPNFGTTLSNWLSNISR